LDWRLAMRVGAKGQLTIPKKLREEVGLLPHTEVEFILEVDGVRIIRAGSRRGSTRGTRVIAGLRASRGEVTMSTDEIMALTRGEP
jgi:AbrB family looped-hinge helix DNA binding protein